MFRQSSISLALVVSLAMLGPAAAGGGAHGGVTVTKGTTSGFNGNVTDHRGDSNYRNGHPRLGPPNGGWKPSGPAQAIHDHR
jgi:hypothetical protein